ncbi:MAG: ABC transporter permease [Chitinophagales bacterium]
MSIYKEFLLLKRDFGGLIILFVMPLILVITITLIQDSTFKQKEDKKISVLMVDLDKSTLSKRIIQNIKEDKAFEIIDTLHKENITENEAKDLVYKGKYPLAIIIPKDVSNDLQRKVNQNVMSIMSKMGMYEKNELDTAVIIPKEIKIYFDPATKNALKSGLINAIDMMISKIEKQEIYTSIQNELGEKDIQNFGEDDFIRFKEVSFENELQIAPNAVQHNVPAWTLFAIFFIVIPLSINIVKEKKQGTKVRLFTSPVSYFVIIMGKTITYLIICLLQFFIMIMVGKYFFPYIGLYALNVEGKMGLMTLIALFAGLAAVGYSVLVGTVFKTQEQSAPFGATSVIILAAIGGIWVPIFMMPKFMQFFARLSPMHWGIEAFYNVLLRNGNLVAILPQLLYFFIFFVATIGTSILVDKYKRSM